MFWLLQFLLSYHRHSRRRLKAAVLGSPAMCREVVRVLGGERVLRAWELRRRERVRWLDAVREARAAGVCVRELYPELWEMRDRVRAGGRDGRYAGMRRLDGGHKRTDTTTQHERDRRMFRLAPLPRLRLERVEGAMPGADGPGADADVAADVRSALGEELWSIEAFGVLADALARGAAVCEAQVAAAARAKAALLAEAERKGLSGARRWGAVAFTADELRSGMRAGALEDGSEGCDETDRAEGVRRGRREGGGSDTCSECAGTGPRGRRFQRGDDPMLC